jgi:hypothetical protein
MEYLVTGFLFEENRFTYEGQKNWFFRDGFATFMLTGYSFRGSLK